MILHPEVIRIMILTARTPNQALNAGTGSCRETIRKKAQMLRRVMHESFPGDTLVRETIKQAERGCK